MPSLIGSMQTIRRDLLHLDRKLLPATINWRIDSRRRKARLKPGLPNGLDQDLVEDVIAERTGSSVSSTSFAPVTNWKPSSYYVSVNLKDGGSWSCFYKDSYYDSEKLGAL